MTTTLERRLGTATRCPRLTMAAQDAARAAEAEWADDWSLDVSPGGGLSLSLWHGGRSRAVLLPASLEFRRSRAAEIGQAVAAVRSELVAGA